MYGERALMAAIVPLCSLSQNCCSTEVELPQHIMCLSARCIVDDRIRNCCSIAAKSTNVIHAGVQRAMPIEALPGHPAWHFGLRSTFLLVNRWSFEVLLIALCMLRVPCVRWPHCLMRPVFNRSIYMYITRTSDLRHDAE